MGQFPNTKPEKVQIPLHTSIKQYFMKFIDSDFKECSLTTYSMVYPSFSCGGSLKCSSESHGTPAHLL
jgi:hypothetical protein